MSDAIQECAGDREQPLEYYVRYFKVVRDEIDRLERELAEAREQLRLANIDACNLQAELAEAKAKDDPECDGTDAAHPAWWRGEEYGFDELCRGVNKILDGKDDGRGANYEPWGVTRKRLLALMAELAEARERAKVAEGILSADMEGDTVLITTKQIDAAWERGKKQPDQNINGFYEGLWSLGIIPCPRCGGTKRVRKHVSDDGTFTIDATCDCTHNGWEIEQHDASSKGRKG